MSTNIAEHSEVSCKDENYFVPEKISFSFAHVFRIDFFEITLVGEILANEAFDSFIYTKSHFFTMLVQVRRHPNQELTLLFFFEINSVLTGFLTD